LPPPSPVVLRPATGLAPADRGISPAPPAIATVVTLLRHEERVRLETVVRQTRVEVAAPPGPAPAAAAPRSREAPERAPASRRWSPPTAAEPLTIAESDIGRLADRVVQQIHRRVVTQRERMGGR
jgi:hypothetical protein